LFINDDLKAFSFGTFSAKLVNLYPVLSNVTETVWQY